MVGKTAAKYAEAVMREELDYERVVAVGIDHLDFKEMGVSTLKRVLTEAFEAEMDHAEQTSVRELMGDNGIFY